MPRTKQSLVVQFADVSLGFGPRLVLDRVSFTLAAGDRVALVGSNGAGKSTVFRLVVGELEPEAGMVECFVPQHAVGYVRQEFPATGSLTVGRFLDSAPPHLATVHGAIAGDEPQGSARYADGWAFAARRHSVVTGLGLDHLNADQLIDSLSGGEQTRLALAQMLLHEPVLLLLDEPTNHLDLQALLWLERYLSAYAGALLVVSHDRVFLDRVAPRTLVLDGGQLESYRGTYTQYLAEREARKERATTAYRQQQEEVARLQRAIGTLESGARAVEASTIAFAPRARAARVARQATVMKRRIERELLQYRLEKPKQGWNLKLDLQPVSDTGQIVLAGRGVRVLFGDRIVLDGVDLELRRGERWAVVGPNGSGKSTLLRVLLGAVVPDAGVVTRGPSVRPGYVAQGHEPLDPTHTVLDVIRRAGSLDDVAARGFAHFLLFSGDAVFTPTGRLSAGERARLAIGALVLEGVNTLVLDEPTNHLDLAAQASLAAVLHDYTGALLVASHNRAFLSALGVTRVLELHGGHIRVWQGLEEYLEQLDV